MRSVDYAVVGGGIVGLATAMAILEHAPEATVTVFEKEPEPARHASGRNSGVLHAGFYYSPDSLKAQLTRAGNESLHRFCEEERVRVVRCGKVVVTRDEAELDTLDLLLERGRANGVPLEMVDEDQLRELEPLARTHGRAIWSPTTSVADPSDVAGAFVSRLTRLGGELRCDERVLAVRRGQLATTGGVWNVGHVVNAAGLQADLVGDWYGVADDYEMLPFKGLYWYGTSNAPTPRRHVYPVPDLRNPFLGVHLTVTPQGRPKIGPTAIPALWREDYGGVAGFSSREVGQIALTYPAFLSSPHHSAGQLIKSEVPKYLRTRLINQCRALVPSVRPQDFTVRGRVGVRAQLFHKPSKRLEMDFIVRHTADSTHLLNVVSPGWTSSLAVARHVTDGMRERGVL